MVKTKGGVQAFLVLLVALIFFALFLVITPIQNVQANFELKDWEFSKPILFPADLGLNGFMGFEPDDHIYANSLENLTDLRVIAESNQGEIPYELLIKRGSESYETIQAEITDIVTVTDSHTSFVVKVRSENSLHNELEIVTSSTDFVRKVKVETTNDLLTWATAEDNAQIYDIDVSKSVANHRNTNLTYPTSSSSFLRITIFDNKDSPLEIQGATISLLQKTPAKYRTYHSSMSSQENAKQPESSQIIIDLNSEGIPTSRMEIFTSDTNFNRKVNIESSPDATNWTLIDQNREIFVYNTGKVREQQLVLLYPEITNRYLKLTFLNGDSPPINIKTIKVHGLQRLLIFEVKSDSRYNIYYGNPFERTRPKYDLGQIIPHLDIENISLAQLGTEQPNVNFERRAVEPLSGRYPWLLPSVVTILVIVLGLILTRILRLTRKSD